jgi:REP element-mobilizing transposase RayT
MQSFETLEHGNFYHVYNHGVGGRNLFEKAENYEYFLSLYDRYISPIAETYAWVLMPNHFHLLVRINEKAEVVASLHLTGFENLSGVKTKQLHQHFSNLFNAYTKAYNKYYETRGALFERPFKRKLIDSTEYLRQVILYIHNNPVHHGFCTHPSEYPWSSYLSCISIKPTKLKRDAVIGWFDSEANFKTRHGEILDADEIDDWLAIN